MPDVITGNNTQKIDQLAAIALSLQTWSRISTSIASIALTIVIGVVGHLVTQGGNLSKETAVLTTEIKNLTARMDSLKKELASINKTIRAKPIETLCAFVSADDFEKVAADTFKLVIELPYGGDSGGAEPYLKVEEIVRWSGVQSATQESANWYVKEWPLASGQQVVFFRCEILIHLDKGSEKKFLEFIKQDVNFLRIELKPKQRPDNEVDGPNGGDAKIEKEI